MAQTQNTALKWSLGGEAPGPAVFEENTPEEAAAIREELSKLEATDQRKRDEAIARGKAKAKAKADPAQ